MDFYKEIENLTDAELEEKVRKKVRFLEEQGEKEENILGYHLDYNPKKELLTEDYESDVYDITVRHFYNGYIKAGSKMVYGAIYSYNGRVAYNDGRYYYVDDNEDYIVAFCKYIKNKEIVDVYELFGYILDFIMDYYGCIEEIDREEMFKMILKDETHYYEPVTEHKLSDFRRRGNMLCSEYSIVAQNILSVFDIESCLLIGKEKTGNENGESHAFNIVTFNKDSGEEVSAIVDFANYIKIYDINYKIIGAEPFVAELDKFDEEFLYNILEKNVHILYDDYAYLVFGNELLKIGYDECRNYYLNSDLTPDEVYFQKK